MPTVRTEHSATALAYAAGFFDGEGNISILRVKSARAGARDMYKAISVTMNTDRPVLEGLRAEFGGRVYAHVVKKRPSHWRPTYQWHLWGDELDAFLQAIRPYVRVKGPLIDNALQFLALKRQTDGKRTTPLHLWTRMKELADIHHELIPKGRLGRTFLTAAPEVRQSIQMELEEQGRLHV